MFKKKKDNNVFEKGENYFKLKAINDDEPLLKSAITSFFLTLLICVTYFALDYFVFKKWVPSFINPLLNFLSF